MAGLMLRVLVVDDYEPWRNFYSKELRKRSDLQVIAQVSDGLDAIEQAQELQPDLILLDIGLPKLNGIESARRIRELSPQSKILFVSENRSTDFARKAMRLGALGYVVKSDAATHLLSAVESVLAGKQFLSVSLAGHDLGASDAEASDSGRPIEYICSKQESLALAGDPVGWPPTRP